MPGYRFIKAHTVGVTLRPITAYSKDTQASHRKFSEEHWVPYGLC